MPLNNTKRCDKDRSIHAKRGVAILNRRIINIGKDYGLRMHGCELRKDQCGTEWYSRGNVGRVNIGYTLCGILETGRTIKRNSKNISN
jgi:hypothetical protein